MKKLACLSSKMLGVTSMSNSWSGYIISWTLSPCLILLLLLRYPQGSALGRKTRKNVGHSFDGTQEYDNPLRAGFHPVHRHYRVQRVYLVLYPPHG